MRPYFCQLYSPRRLCSTIFRTPSLNNLSNVDITSLPLTVPTSFAQSPPLKDFIEDGQTKITTLNSGLKIASQDKFGAQCAMGVIVNAGPRYEVNRLSGISHYLEKLGFHSSNSFVNRNAVQAALEECNAIFDCQIARDFIIYAVSGLRSNMERLMHALADTVLRARITEEEVQMAERSIRFELQALQRAPPVEPLINELLHSTAFRGNNTLGLPRYCPEYNLGKITRDHIINFVVSHYKPERMVVAGVGVQHDAFVDAAEKAFSPCVHELAKDPAAKDSPEPDASVAQYTGGYLKVERDLSQYHAPMPEFAHAAIGFQSVGYRDPQFVPACLLHSLLGGGGSFSAGGPGKGMYTRLYVNVLNEFHWINSAQAENHSYADTGLFSVIGSSDPLHLDRLVRVLVDELRRTAESPLPIEEVDRAKAQLKSMLLMNLETRAVTFEDIARQVLTTGCRHQPKYWADKIDEVTASDVQDLLHRLLTQSPPTIVGFGRVERLPSREEIFHALTQPMHTSSLGQRFPSLFKRFV